MFTEGKGSRAQPTQSIVAFPWQDLQGDMKLEILSWLPPKSIVRFKCVCKYWFSLFSNPSFIHKHILHRAATVCGDDDDDNTLLLHGYDRNFLRSTFLLLKLKDPSNPITFNINRFPDENDLCDMDVIGSINGLVCLCSGRRPDGSILILWNPTTKQYTNIPTPNIKFPNPKGYFSIGFCFDSLRNDYKIVRLVWCVTDQPRPPPRAEVYSVNADFWREIEVGISFDYVHSKCDTIVRGEPYWSAHSYSVERSAFVVWFDACEEVFRKGPPSLTSWNISVQPLVNFENSLAALTSQLSETAQPRLEWMISLWVMEDESSTWSTKFSAAGFSSYPSPVGCSKNGEIVFFSNNNDKHVMQLYNPKTKEISNIQIDDLEGLSLLRFRASDYAVSLVPVRKSKQAEKEGTTGSSDSYISAP